MVFSVYFCIAIIKIIVCPNYVNEKEESTREAITFSVATTSKLDTYENKQLR